MKCCFTSTETVGLLGTGAQDGHLDFHTAPELCSFRRGTTVFLFTTRLHSAVSRQLITSTAPRALLTCQLCKRSQLAFVAFRSGSVYAARLWRLLHPCSACSTARGAGPAVFRPRSAPSQRASTPFIIDPRAGLGVSERVSCCMRPPAAGS